MVLVLFLTMLPLIMCVCVCMFRNVNQEAVWKSHPAVIMRNGTVFILKWGVITGLSLWDRARDERMSRKGAKRGRERASEARVGGKCASIIWRAWCISCCGLGAGHYVSSHLENMKLNTGRPEWNSIRSHRTHWCRTHTERQTKKRC